MEEYLRCARKACPGRTATAARGGDLAYWLLLPQWLALPEERWRDPVKKSISDVLWGQYALYLSIRIDDDLLDKQAQSGNLPAVARYFMDESCRTFHKDFSESSDFWREFQHHVDWTNSAIRQVDALQRGPVSPPNMLLALYAEQSSIFKVGSLAVCVMLEKPLLFAHVSEFADHVAAASQIVDDFQDMGEDLSQGRLNFAARVILGDSCKPPFDASRVLAQIAQGVLFEDHVNQIFSEVRSQLQLAKNAMSSIVCPGCLEYLISYGSILNEMEMELHRRRVDCTIGNVA